ncbi:type IV pilus modification protein PilV [Denitratisoma oestradiolicum]|uniref:Type IV pilus modification protein PilV n=1 Tax=Denitratisoma oestradiolicum TaxID=311182 RepID=A0A6S6XV40_9PROT|nr:type IV pilus modification protein PilV [Denitratisoma oestradiolicum]TWO79563.1 type IV pilus modification protein PilV [Denitratisoma oestradiolicum]CAB1368043.1 Type IV pilus modification protein PilV [Denitratisoma oestradiolicum]
MLTITPYRQSGIVLIEALMGILIFSLGILSMVALQATAISAQNDAQFRIEAANLADRIIGEIDLNVDRTSSATLQNSLVAYAHQAATDATCAFSGDASANQQVIDWLADVATQLPGSAATMQQIAVTTAAFNQVTVTLCWQTAADATPRRHTVIAYVN